MKKKFLSVALALALCLSLTVPAMAYIDEGPGWTYDTDTNTLTLNGAHGDNLDLNILYDVVGGKNEGTHPTVVLAPGSKNTYHTIAVDCPIDDGAVVAYTDVTFKGTGELIITTAYEGECAMSGQIGNVKLEDGLTMTGGTKVGDSYPVKVEYDGICDWGNNVKYYEAKANGVAATYMRIGPAAGSSAAPAPSAPASTGFTDVAASSPYAEAIKWAVENGITKGTTATTFSPNTPCTDGQFWTFVWRANGSPVVSNAARGPSEADRALAWAASKRYIGDGTQDYPQAPCERQRAMLFLYNIAGKPEPSKMVTFSDVASTSPYRWAISWAVEQGITNGTTATTFSPTAICTRGQIMTFLYRASK